MTNPTAQTPEGWRIGAGFSEFLHGVGHGALDGECACLDKYGPCVNCADCFICSPEADDDDDTPAVCQHGRDDYCRPCNARERAEARELGL